MRILCVTVLFDQETGGGTAERTLQLVNDLSSRGHQVTLLTTNIGLTASRRNEVKGPLVGLNCLFRRFYVVEPRLFTVSRLVRQADIIHMMGLWNILNVLVYLFTRFHGVPYVICPAGELKLFGRSLGLKKLFNFLIGRAIVKNANGKIAITEEELPDFGLYGVPPSAVRLLPNGISLTALASQPDTDVLKRLDIQKKQYLLFMGRLNPIKGPDLLLQAFTRIAPRYPHLHLVLAGPDGGMRHTLAEEASRNDLTQRVHFAGYVSGAHKATLYRQALFLCIPSRHEAMSIVVLEAGVVSVPVLLTNRCGFDQVAEQGAGIVVEAEAGSLSEGIDALLQRPGDLVTMGQHLNRLVASQYSWDRIGKLHEDYFRSIVHTA